MKAPIQHEQLLTILERTTRILKMTKEEQDNLNSGPASPKVDLNMISCLLIGQPDVVYDNLQGIPTEIPEDAKQLSENLLKQSDKIASKNKLKESYRVASSKNKKPENKTGLLSSLLSVFKFNRN